MTGGKRSGRGRDGGGTCANVQSVYIYDIIIMCTCIRVSSTRVCALQDVHIDGIVFYFAGRLKALAFRHAIFRFSTRFQGVVAESRLIP